MHPDDDVGHRRQRGVVGVDHDVDAVAKNVQVSVGDQDGDLDQLVRAQIQPGHLTVDPHQFVPHTVHPRKASWRTCSHPSGRDSK